MNQSRCCVSVKGVIRIWWMTVVRVWLSSGCSRAPNTCNSPFSAVSLGDPSILVRLTPGTTTLAGHKNKRSRGYKSLAAVMTNPSWSVHYCFQGCHCHCLASIPSFLQINLFSHLSDQFFSRNFVSRRSRNFCVIWEKKTVYFPFFRGHLKLPVPDRYSEAVFRRWRSPRSYCLKPIVPKLWNIKCPYLAH